MNIAIAAELVLSLHQSFNQSYQWTDPLVVCKSSADMKFVKRIFEEQFQIFQAIMSNCLNIFSYFLVICSLFKQHPQHHYMKMRLIGQIQYMADCYEFSCVFIKKT